MTMPYLNGRRWSDLSREERFYCFVLYSHVVANPNDFARFVCERAGLTCDTTGEWDVGVEVCFYRDYLWHHNLPVRGSEYSPKRTFDLCLFGQRDMIIIEAKVCQTFDSEQSAVFEDDSRKVRSLLERPDFGVWLVALASSSYFEQERRFGNGEAMRPFGDRKISWADVHGKYGDLLLAQADTLYGSRGRLLERAGD